ncbi:MAG TPA: hypothetical protein PKO06_19650, partial [Candidatus Ozemobacteraceae bacterium]|nr:hypothetical protein [Candidatus Ozemobacteraceae bacterium]
MDELQQRQLESLKREIDRRHEEHRAGASGKRRWRRLFRLFLLGAAALFLVLAVVFFVNFLRLNQELVEVQIGQRLLPRLLGGKAAFSFARRSGNILSKPVLEQVVIRNPAFSSGGALLFIGRAELSYSLLDVFWGKATLEKILLDDVVVTLSHNE